jgi:hypothetical protein
MATKNPNIALKIAIVESQRTQREIAAEIRMPAPRLSKIVNGASDLSPALNDDERRALAALLGKPVEQLFPEVAA